MEGFLQVLVKKKFVRQWCVLEGQQFCIYDNIDLVKQESVDIKGVIDVKNAEIMLIAEDSRDFCVSITPYDAPKSLHILDCGDNNTANTWYRALSKASIEHETEKKRQINPIELARHLKIEVESPEELSQNMIKKAYRKISLKEHPDKGGDVIRFKEIQTIYSRLMAYQVEEDERQTCDEIEYEAVIEKGGNGVGLGIVVEPDQDRRRIIVQTVQKEIILKSLSREANGEILPGDVLSYIEKDDCRKWPMSRLRARLNGFRVPVGSSVRILFTRRVPRTSFPHESLSPFSLSSQSQNITPKASPKRFRNPSAETEQTPRSPIPDMIGAEEISIHPLDTAPSTDISEAPSQPPPNVRSTSITSAVANDILLNEIDAYISVVDESQISHIDYEASNVYNLNQELNEYKEKLSVLTIREKSLNEENTALRQQLLKLGADCDDTKSHNVELRQEIATCQSELEEVKQRIEVLTSGLEDSEKQGEVLEILSNLDRKQETAAALKTYSSIRYLLTGLSDGHVPVHVQTYTSSYAQREARGAAIVQELDELLDMASKSVPSLSVA